MWEMVSMYFDREVFLMRVFFKFDAVSHLHFAFCHDSD